MLCISDALVIWEFLFCWWTQMDPPNPHCPRRIGQKFFRSFGWKQQNFWFVLEIEYIRNWFEKKDLDAIQQWKCTEFFCGSFLYFFLIFLRSFFKGKVLGKSSISGWDGVPGHNGPLGTPGHNGPLGTHWGPHGAHAGPTWVQHGSMLDPCWSNMGAMLDPCWSKMVRGQRGLGGARRGLRWRCWCLEYSYRRGWHLGGSNVCFV